MIHYRLIAQDPAAHLFAITLTVAEPATDGQRLSLPAWIPGSYMIRDFAKNIVSLEAECRGQAVAVSKLDKQTWHCAPCDGPLTVRYTVYAWDLSVRSAHLDTTHGYFNGTSVFLQVHGQEAKPCRVELQRPEGPAYAEWRLATTLARDGAELYGFGSYRAADYDDLIDHPVEMGRFTLIEFEAGGTPHAMVLSGRHYADTERLARDLKRICEYQIGLFGELPAMERYLFLTQVVGDGYGGLEHRDSCSLLCSRHDLPLPGDPGIGEEYRGFLGLCSHEYFHTWNIKRIKPAAFLPYDLSRESHTPLLWAFEGITAYYDDLSLVRCGLIEAESYLELLGQTITRVLRGSGRLKQSVAESSFDAWTKFYKQDENAPNAIVSYYTKGSLVAMALDLTLRCQTDDRLSLDDVMRRLWQDHGKPQVGVTATGIEALIETLSGLDLKAFFDQALRSTADLDLAGLLQQVGVNLALRPARDANDKGGKPSEQTAATTLGLRSAEDPLGARIVNVFEGGAAIQAGLAAGDIIVAIDGLRCTQANLEKRLKPFAPGDSLTLHAFRRDELMHFHITLQAPPADTAYLSLAEALDEQVRARREHWLNRPITS